MNILKIVITILCIAFINSCTSNKADLKTSTLSQNQLSSSKRVSSALENANLLAKDFGIWRKAIKERTYAAIAAGNRDIGQVKKLVYKQTESEELKARKYLRAYNEVFIILGIESVKSSGDFDADFLKKYESIAINDSNNMQDTEFSKDRDELIEQYFMEAIEGLSKPSTTDSFKKIESEKCY